MIVIPKARKKHKFIEIRRNDDGTCSFVRIERIVSMHTRVEYTADDENCIDVYRVEFILDDGHNFIGQTDDLDSVLKVVESGLS